MIRASTLYGRAVIDLDAAERIGAVDEIIVDPYGPGVAGYVVAGNRSIFGRRKRLIIPTEAIHAIGPDALTIRNASAPDYHQAHLDALPRLSELTGRRMISFGGRLLGAIEDALISDPDGRIVGYPLDPGGASSWLDTVFGLTWKSDHGSYVRADAGLRIGVRLIVVPDDAIASSGDLDGHIVDDRGRSEQPVPPAAPLTPHRDAEEARPADDGAASASQAQTAPFTPDERPVSDEGLGLEPLADADRDDGSRRPDADLEQGTGALPGSRMVGDRP